MRLRLIILLIIGWLGWITLRRWWRNQKYFSIHKQPPPMRMVRCAYCGIYIPQKSALRKDANWYCSNAHLDMDHSNPPSA